MESFINKSTEKHLLL